MKKGQKKRVWTKEQKLEIINKHLKEHVSVRSLEKEYNADRSMICHWIRDYNELGEKGLDPKGHKGNPYAALHTKNNLTEIERLRLELAKKEVECERLKKGYSVKGVGQRKEYVIINKKNSK